MVEKRIRTQKGFTLVELLVAMALALVVMGMIFRTFKIQQDSYVIQDQVVAMQQNLRSAMYVISRDLQMAGFYSNFDSNTFTMDWDDNGASEGIRPLLHAGDNVSTGGDDIRDNTDTIVIVKAGAERRALAGTEKADVGVITLTSRDLDGDGADDLNNTGKKYGLLVKEDLRAADFFEVDSASGNITPPAGLSENYTTGDLICRADVIIYRIDEDAAHPKLRRKNLGDDNGFQVIAENVDNLQFRYQLSDGTWTNDPAGNQHRVRAIQVFLLGRTSQTNRGWTDPETYVMANVNYAPGDNYRRKLMCTTVKARNIGL